MPVLEDSMFNFLVVLFVLQVLFDGVTAAALLALAIREFSQARGGKGE